MSDISLCGKRGNKSAVTMLKHFLALLGCQVSREFFDPAHLLIATPDNRRLACLVRAGTMQRRERWSLTTHTYLKRERIMQLLDWVRVQPLRTDAVIIYVLHGNGRPAPGAFRFAGAEFHLVALDARKFADRMRPRSAAWDKVQISSSEFENLAMPLEAWIVAQSPADRCGVRQNEAASDNLSPQH